MFTSLPEVKQLVRKYIQCHTVLVSLPELQALTEHYIQQIRPDEEKFLTFIDAGFLITTEIQLYNIS